MDKAKINLITIGHLPLHIDFKKILAWESELFELVGNIDNISLRCDSDIEGWTFSDELLKDHFPIETRADFTVAIVNVPIEGNFYFRRLGDNKAVFTFNQIKDFLIWDNIPLENAILRCLYGCTLIYRRSQNRIPSLNEASGFTHDETRGCIFDMNGIKSDLIESCHEPILCEECRERLRNSRISNQMIKITQDEIRKIRKSLYYRVFDFVKLRPIIALFISSAFAIILGIAGSIISSVIYDGLIK